MTMQSPAYAPSGDRIPSAQSLLDELVIAAYDTGVPLLDQALDALDEVLVLAAEAEHAARRPENPLPVPPGGVGVHLAAVPHAVGEHGVDVAQRDGGAGLVGRLG